MLAMIQKQLPADDAETMATQLVALQQLMTPVHISLNDTQRIGLRTMAEGREGFAKLVSDIALTNTENLPRNEDPKALSEVLDYYSILSKLRLSAAKLLEMLDDTQTAAGADVMNMVDRYTAHLQTARKSNNALDSSMNEVDAWNSRFGKSPGKEDEPDEPE